MCKGIATFYELSWNNFMDWYKVALFLKGEHDV